MPTRTPKRQLLAICLGCALIGALIAWNALLAAAVGAGLAVAFYAVTALRSVTALPGRPLEYWLAATILYLPVAPYLAVHLPVVPYIGATASLASAFRFALAGALVVMLVIGLVPLRRGPSPALVWGAVAFVLLQVVAAVLSPSSSYALLRFLNWTMFIPLAFVAFDRRAVRVVFASLAAAGLILLAGIGLQITGTIGGTWGGTELSSAASGYSSWSKRYTSFIQNPNDLALFMVALALTVVGFSLRLQGWRRVVLLAFGAVCLAVVFLASSRGALIGVPLGLLIVASRTYLRASTAVLAAFVVLAIGLASPPLQLMAERTIGSLASIAAGTDLSANMRLAVWDERLSHVSNPIVGTGYGGYGFELSTGVVREEQRVLNRQLTVDNGWLKLWLEEGFAGLLALLVVMGAALRRGLSRTLADESRLVGAVAAAVLLVLMIRSTSNDVFDINPWNCFTWLAIGMLSSLPLLGPGDETREGGHGGRPPGVLQVKPELRAT